ncbi:putative vancomycin resistance protein [Desulfosporosinus orientis DSM 765]|uniref:Putative vancomycin resistance protein n=1 Tax=Desulfosporosinus orientis (strain ATCC 19365 / DSM 765 / NCIMB 8382 / VKM B-1628 / Singapore I) TaxID=768706 RepID=G7W5K8_DESOD|nr:VanW family protein [Desulfosporosinus orientis]AET66655.1 putative vancomycin resistance protein [Desulfosporosinus orientis DSM 765]
MIKHLNVELKNLFFSGLIILCLIVLSGCDSNQISLPDKLSLNGSESQSKLATGVLPEGTKVDDLDLSGTPVPEASAKIENWAKDKLEETRVLLYNNTEIPLALSDIGVKVDTERIIDNAKLSPGTSLSSVLTVNSLTANQELAEKLSIFNKPAKDATYTIQNDKVLVQPGENGQIVSVEQLIAQIKNTPLKEVPNRIEVPIVEVQPVVTTESIEALAFDSVIGEYSTKFLSKEKNRSANLTKAAKALDGLVLLPGEVLSFNDKIGPREPETGYKEAYVIVNGEYVQGTGGGICQVSSTLYNAALLSNLEIVERMPHAVAVKYVPPGQDATVNYPNIDFKLKNNTASLVYIRTDVQPGTLTIRILGKKTDKTVRIEGQVEKTIPYKTERRYDPKLPKGRVLREQSGSKGVIVNTWQIIRDGKGNETKKFLGRDRYAPANRILRIGT